MNANGYTSEQVSELLRLPPRNAVTELAGVADPSIKVKLRLTWPPVAPRSFTLVDMVGSTRIIDDGEGVLLIGTQQQRVGTINYRLGVIRIASDALEGITQASYRYDSGKNGPSAVDRLGELSEE